MNSPGMRVRGTDSRSEMNSLEICVLNLSEAIASQSVHKTIYLCFRNPMLYHSVLVAIHSAGGLGIDG